MAVRVFLRSTNLLRVRNIFFEHARTQMKWNMNFKVCQRQWNQQRTWNFTKLFRKKFLVASLGFFGLFKFLEDEEKDEPVKDMIMTIKTSIFLIQKEEYNKAEQMLHVALRQAQTLQHDKGITYIYYVMGDLAFQLEDVQKAKDLYKSVMKRLISSGTPQDDQQIIHISLKVAKLYEKSGEPRIAEEGYHFCIQNMDKHVKNNPNDEDTLALWATSKDWYARLLMSESRYSEALDNFLQAYQMCVQLYGKQHQWSIVLLNDMGMVSSILGKLDSALAYIQEAIKLGEKMVDVADLSEMYINLGYIYMAKYLYKEANAACLEGLKRAKQSGKQDCLEEANVCLTELKGKF